MAAGWAVLEMDTLGVHVGRVLAAEREELIALMVAARREPDPAVRERCESEIRELRVQHQRALAERLCTEARLRRQFAREHVARLLNEPIGFSTEVKQR